MVFISADDLCTFDPHTLLNSGCLFEIIKRECCGAVAIPGGGSSNVTELGERGGQDNTVRL